MQIILKRSPCVVPPSPVNLESGLDKGQFAGWHHQFITYDQKSNLNVTWRIGQFPLCPLPPTILQWEVLHSEHLWLTGKMDSPDQSQKRCLYWSEISLERSKIEVGRSTQQETDLLTAQFTDY